MQPVPPSDPFPADDAGPPGPADFWPGCGYRDLQRAGDGTLAPTPAWWRRFLDRPELQPPPEACRHERALHAALQADPLRPVSTAELARVADADARENFAVFLRFRDALQRAGSVQAHYLALMRGGRVDIPPLFVDLLAQVIVRHLLEGEDDALRARAGELLFRAQRVSTEGGQILAGDRDELDMLNETGGFGEIGRLLAQAQAALRQAELQVLGADNAAAYWANAARGLRWPFLLDLRTEVAQVLAKDLTVPLPLARSGPKALAEVLQRWVQHLLGVRVRIVPRARIDDAQWRWHIGLDAESSAILNALYQGEEVGPERLARMVALWELQFDDPADVHPEVAGRPVYLGLAMTADGVVKLKPQNLLLNLPLAPRG
jgi:hypothetical protein